MADPTDLERFVAAQDGGGTYRSAVAELERGRKAGHWMWFVFPQLAGLGSSPTARRYALASREEAAAYAAHPVLGPRLRRCAALLLAVDGRSAGEILGPVDALKLRSSMTLFLRAVPDEPVFASVLGRFFDGRPDPRTDDRLGRPG